MNTRTQFISTTGALLLLLSLSPAANAAFTDNGDGTVTDTVTGLMWDQCSQGQSGSACATGAATTMTWSAALTAAVTAINANYKGYADWRLPNKNELESLGDIAAATAPTINLTAFPATPGILYWSSTTYTHTPSAANAWLVNFDNFDVGVDVKTNSFAVRLVRSRQWFDSFAVQVRRSE